DGYEGPSLISFTVTNIAACNVFTAHSVIYHKILQNPLQMPDWQRDRSGNPSVTISHLPLPAKRTVSLN
ncbi:MAG: hypothetical protein JXR54_04725, partial [Tannerellaceae bacterium]|nr:hypothetical protein [Tannerellaceae bacterium]